MESYLFVYKDSQGQWFNTTSPRFVARHLRCRAVSRESLRKLGYQFVSDFCHALNDPSHNSPALTQVRNDYNIY
jgi:hypothetical protein